MLDPKEIIDRLRGGSSTEDQKVAADMIEGMYTLGLQRTSEIMAVEAERDGLVKSIADLQPRWLHAVAEHTRMGVKYSDELHKNKALTAERDMLRLEVTGYQFALDNVRKALVARGMSLDEQRALLLGAQTGDSKAQPTSDDATRRELDQARDFIAGMGRNIAAFLRDPSAKDGL